MTYNLTAVADANTTVQILQNVNTYIMNDYLGILILLILAGVLYINFVYFTKQPIKSFTGTAFICSLASMLLFVIEMLPSVVIFICLIATGLSIAFWNLE